MYTPRLLAAAAIGSSASDLVVAIMISSIKGNRFTLCTTRYSKGMPATEIRDLPRRRLLSIRACMIALVFILGVDDFQWFKEILK